MEADPINPEILYEYFGEPAPVTAFGAYRNLTFDFRARWEYWRFVLSTDPDIEAGLFADDFDTNQEYLERHMSERVLQALRTAFIAVGAMSSATNDFLTLVTSFRPNATDSFYSYLYLQDDFRAPDSEQFIEIQYGIEGSKSQYPTIIHFWLHSLYSHLEDSGADTNRFSDVAKLSKRKPITRDEIEQTISPLLAELKKPVSFEYRGEVVQALQMFDDWDSIAIVGETDQGYFAFYWETTA